MNRCLPSLPSTPRSTAPSAPPSTLTSLLGRPRPGGRTSPAGRHRPAALVLLLAAFALPAGTALLLPTEAQAQAIQRPFPPAARRAFLTVGAAPEIVLNGNPERLSPGARIRSTTNSLVMPANIAGQRLLVNYTRDPQGLVHEVWILTEAEAQEKRPGLETVFNFRFGSETDQPKRDDGRTPFDQLPKFPNQ